MQSIGNISGVGETLSNGLPTVRRAKVQFRVPPIFAIWKKKDIVQWDIGRMQVVYNLQLACTVLEYDITLTKLHIVPLHSW